MTIKIYEVGGSIRDSFLGKVNKDLDYSVEAPSYEAMVEHIESTHKKLIKDKNGNPIGHKFLTVRAIGNDGLAKDYVMCRKEGAYSDQRHPDSVEVGTIYDDLARRDFTVNATARDVETGDIIDPHGGIADLKEMTLRAVGSAEKRFKEDPLRMIRAVRFSITKNLCLHYDIFEILNDGRWAKELRTVSTERIREEMYKCFKHDTAETLLFLRTYCSEEFVVELFNRGLWLKPTLEK